MWWIKLGAKDTNGVSSCTTTEYIAYLLLNRSKIHYLTRFGSCIPFILYKKHFMIFNQQMFRDKTVYFIHFTTVLISLRQGFHSNAKWVKFNLSKIRVHTEQNEVPPITTSHYDCHIQIPRFLIYGFSMKNHKRKSTGTSMECESLARSICCTSDVHCVIISEMDMILCG